MNQHKQHRDQFGATEDQTHHTRGSYWKRAHRDSRFWFGVILMVAMVIFVMRSDLALPWGGKRQPNVSGAVGR